MNKATNSPTTKSDIKEIANFLRHLLQENRDEEAINLVIELLEAVRDKNTSLELKLQKLLKQHYGRKSEKVSSEQLSLFLSQLAEEQDSGPVLEDDAELEEETEVAAHSRRKKKRRPLPEDIIKVQHEHLVDDEHRFCEHCGVEKQTIGHDVRKVLDFEPARFVLHEHLLEKLACKKCQDGVVMAKAPGKVIAGGIPGPGLLAELIVNKYRDALPLHRQAQRFERHGLNFAQSTMVGWIGYASQDLEPIAELIKKQALQSHVLATDGTGLSVLDKSHPNNIKKGSLFCHVGDSKALFFAYAPNQRQEVPQEILRQREGYLVLDAAGIYNGLFDHPDSKAIEVGCMMHCRRYFYKAFDLGDLRAGIALRSIKRLYKIEAKAKREKMKPQRLYRFRQRKAKPVLDDLGTWIKKVYKNEPPKTPFYKALTYAKNQWQALNRYLEDGCLPIDNGEVERAIRTVAVGRKNYLFAGSDAGAERTAILYTIIGTCTLAGVNPWLYLRDVLDKIANDWPNNRLEELLPSNWQPPDTKSVD